MRSAKVYLFSPAIVYIMQAPNHNRPKSTGISQVIDRVLTSGKITRADESVFLRAMVNDHPLNSEEMNQINHVFDRLQMGLLKVVD